MAEIARTDGGDTGAGAPIGRGGDRVARLAAGGTIAAVDAVMTGDIDAAYALVRPPGHHAMADEGMGFCVFNNAVVAARQAQRVHGAERVFILDWDVHHGNGTQAAFWADPSVLFISLHQDDLYPPGGARPIRSASATGRDSRSTFRCRLAPETAATPRPSTGSSRPSPGSSIRIW